ncbi:poly(ADP-ribose) polymerase (plasmid) [Jeotgalibacillus malaysiensis]|uniref:Poly(ADP-ribose) polymerase n=1 Tax=Jeotgalibacillus malaysiensis TaxID=1508404 RepID=A0A0B5AXL3_9BACL|nr:WGR domain-containing protein [Jeotgalibacillus malaysiensis]AJD93422.1 poly(ADP-ribose) polymerase [Jeotgalibacillus malaysiensis]
MATAVNASYSNFQVQKVHRKDILNYASLGANSNKFYILEIQEGIGKEPFAVYCEYGRLGSNPQKKHRFFSSLYGAEREYEKIKRSKESKGYKVVDVQDQVGQVKVEVKDARTKEVSQIKNKVHRLIGKLYQSATSYLVSSIQTPLGKISGTQVAKGLAVLKQIEELLDKGNPSIHQVQRLSDEFYSVIPVPFGSRVDVKRFLIDDYVKLNDKKDLLGVMSSVVQAQDTLEKTLQEKYESLNIKLKPLSSRTKEYKRLVEKVNNSHSSHHRFKVGVSEIFEVEDMVGHNEFNPYNVETMELFHGSRNENILSIMQSGLKIKPSSAVHTGSMFGSGIYFASEVTKSANYCWGFGNASNDSYYMFICEVATGKIKDYDSAQSHLRSAPSPYNSVRGVKGRSLYHDEYIVYKDNQVKIKYIVEFKKN